MAAPIDFSQYVPDIVNQVTLIVTQASGIIALGAAVSYGIRIWRRITHLLADPGLDNFTASLEEAEAWANDTEFASDVAREAQRERWAEYCALEGLEDNYSAALSDLGSVTESPEWWDIESEPSSLWDR